MRGRGLAAGVLLLGCLAKPAAADPAAAVDVLLAVNQVRIANGLPPLAADPRLASLSQNYAAVMAESGCLAHDCGELGRVGERAERAGLAYRLIGEALAGGPADAGRVVQLWLASSGHRAILLNPEVSAAGVGYVQNAADGPLGYGHYWVLTVTLQD
jgi:uncharacterized protein YkwD